MYANIHIIGVSYNVRREARGKKGIKSIGLSCGYKTSQTEGRKHYLGISGSTEVH